MIRVGSRIPCFLNAICICSVAILAVWAIRAPLPFEPAASKYFLTTILFPGAILGVPFIFAAWMLGKRFGETNIARLEACGMFCLSITWLLLSVLVAVAVLNGRAVAAEVAAATVFAGAMGYGVYDRLRARGWSRASVRSNDRPVNANRQSDITPDLLSALCVTCAGLILGGGSHGSPWILGPFVFSSSPVGVVCVGVLVAAAAVRPVSPSNARLIDALALALLVTTWWEAVTLTEWAEALQPWGSGQMRLSRPSATSLLSSIPFVLAFASKLRFTITGTKK